MRDLVRQIVSNFASTKLEGEQEGIIRFSGLEPGTKRPVLIQIVPRLLGKEPGIAVQFSKLAQLIRQLNHPNIASVREVGERAGLPYVITRMVEKAQPLAARMNRPWAVDAAADVVMQAGQALEHAYRKGLVHGSLSPQNVQVQENGRVQVTDFGISQLLDVMGVQLKQVTSPFAAPERAAGKRSDPRADVYSLGAILYTLLAGRPPEVVQGQVLPPGRFNPEVPVAMDQVVVKALSQDPMDRYRDVAAFLVALGAVRLAPMAVKLEALTLSGRCPRCGATKPAGRFCRRCGAPLAEARSVAVSAAPSEASPLTAAVPKGEEVPATEGRTLVSAALAGEGMIPFPEPLPMPEVKLDEVWQALRQQSETAMPKPLPMPVVDWAEAAPPMPEMPAIEKTL